MKTKAERIRTLLNLAHEGLTVTEIEKRLEIRDDLIRSTLDSMPDVYIAKWRRTEKGGGYVAVWCAVHVPPNAPRPKTPNSFKRELQRKIAERHRYNKKLEKMAIQEPQPQQEPDLSSGPKTRWVKVPSWQEAAQ